MTAQDTEAIRAARETLPRDLREWAPSLDLAADRDRLPRGTAARLLREAATTVDRLVARLEAADKVITAATEVNEQLGTGEWTERARARLNNALLDARAALAAAAPGETEQTP